MILLFIIIDENKKENKLDLILIIFLKMKFYK